MTVSLNALAGKDFTTLTLVTGVVTATALLHIVKAQADTSPIDDLVTITAGHSALTGGGNTYRPLLIIKAFAGDTITIKHGTGNIYIPSGSDMTLTENNLALLLYDGTNWHLMNAVGQAVTFAVTNWTNDVALDCDAAAVAETNDVLGTLIKHLIANGTIGGTVSA